MPQYISTPLSQFAREKNMEIPAHDTDAKMPLERSEERANSGQESNGTVAATVPSLKDRLWLFELLAWALCASGLIAIVIILLVIQNKPMPSWTAQRKGSDSKLTVTINSVISIFGTLIKSTLLIPVVASLHQLKWVWFRNDRPLADVKLFEGAGKGPLGSAIMIWTFRGKSLACFGAFITIASLGMDFTLQQLVTYPLRPTAAGVATLGKYRF
jgi:hypothetical protein